MKNTTERIKELPPEIRREVEDFVEFLMKKRVRKARGKPRFNWAEALMNLDNDFDRTDLGRKAPTDNLL